jgi:F-type H+-transporting ATPase subunit gamma
MPSLKAIRKRITSVKNTQKITRAMKLVAAAKLRRAQEAITAARPYSVALGQVVAELAEAVGPSGGHVAHPLMAPRDRTRTQLVLMSSDRGLAGSFNAQLFRATERYIATELVEAESVGLRVVGKKGRDYFKRRGSVETVSFTPAATGPTALDFSRDMANAIVDAFTGDQVDRVLLVFTEFRSAISQKPTVLPLLPIEPPASDDAEYVESGREPTSADFVFEPSVESLLEHLLPLYIQNGLYRAALESIASEFGARMSAMDAATRNAGEMIDRLTLDFNRARQAAITKELLEIIGGAEALKG